MAGMLHTGALLEKERNGCGCKRHKEASSSRIVGGVAEVGAVDGVVGVGAAAVDGAEAGEARSADGCEAATEVGGVRGVDSAGGVPIVCAAGTCAGWAVAVHSCWWLCVGSRPRRLPGRLPRFGGHAVGTGDR